MSFITPAAGAAKDRLTQEFPALKFGIYNRRKIAGSTVWSQHSWPNALDLFFTQYGDTSGEHQLLLDEVHTWLFARRVELNIRTLLWRTTAHYDHIHVDFWPKGYGTPSTIRGGGDNRYKTKSGEVIAQWELDLEDEVPQFDEDTAAVLQRIADSDKEDLTQPGEVFHDSWGEAVNEGILSAESSPVDLVSKQEFAAFALRIIRVMESGSADEVAAELEELKNVLRSV